MWPAGRSRAGDALPAEPGLIPPAGRPQPEHTAHASRPVRPESTRWWPDQPCLAARSPPVALVQDEPLPAHTAPAFPESGRRYLLPGPVLRPSHMRRPPPVLRAHWPSPAPTASTIRVAACSASMALLVLSMPRTTAHRHAELPQPLRLRAGTPVHTPEGSQAY